MLVQVCEGRLFVSSSARRDCLYSTTSHTEMASDLFAQKAFGKRTNITVFYLHRLNKGDVDGRSLGPAPGRPGFQSAALS